MHQIMWDIFNSKEITHRWVAGESQVAYYLSDLKVGYFVVKLHGDKLVIHTFLFLTNNATPEGEKLNRLLNTDKKDKMYLDIDNLPSFNAYHIDQNEKLSELFKDAGCGSLLKLGHVKEFTEIDIKDKNSQSIEHYLESSPHFRRKSGEIL